MTLNEKKPSLLFGTNENGNEIWIEIDKENLFVLAALMAVDSTMADREGFYDRYPGAHDAEELYEHEFMVDYDTAIDFAANHNLPYNILEI